MSDLRDDFMPQNNVAAPGDSNDNGLADFRAVESEEGGNKGRIIAALAVVLLAGAAGVYAYSVSGGAPASRPVAAKHVAMKPPAPPLQKMAAAPQQPAPSASPDATPRTATPANKSTDASPQQTADATPPKPVAHHHRARGPMTAEEMQRIDQKAAEQQAKADNMPASVVQLAPGAPQQMAANTPAPAATQPDQGQPAAQQQAAQQPVTQPAIAAPSAPAPEVATNPAAPAAPEAAQQPPAAQPAPIPAPVPTPAQQPGAGPDPALATPPAQ